MVSHFAASEGHASPIKERCRITFPSTAMRKSSSPHNHVKASDGTIPSDAFRTHTPHVRGGSVSRRGLTQLTRNRPHLQAEPSKKKRPNLNASRSSGGSAREGLLSEKPPPSHTPVRPTSSGGGPGEALLVEKRPPPEFSHSPYSSHMRVNSLREMAQTRFWSLLEQPLEIMTKTKRLSGSK